MVSCSSEGEFETDYKVYEVQGNVRQVIYKNVNNNSNDVVATFNKAGMLVSEKMRGRMFEYQYDGMYVRSLKAYIGDSLELKRSYTYKKNLPVEIREYDNVGTYRKRVHYDYDDRGNRTKGVILNPYNDTLFVWDYSFVDNLVQQEVRLNYQNGAEFKQRFDYLYDDKNELCAIVEYEDSVLMTKTEYKNYRGIPLPSKIIRYWNDEVSASTDITYGFDEKGNWIFKRSVSANGREQRQERTIVYYKN